MKIIFLVYRLLIKNENSKVVAKYRETVASALREFTKQYRPTIDETDGINAVTFLIGLVVGRQVVIGLSSNR